MLHRITSTFFTKGLVALINLSVLLLASKQLGATVIGQVSLIILNISIIQTISEVYTGSSLVYFIPKGSLKKIYSLGLVWTCAAVLLINVIFVFFGIGLLEFWKHTALLSFLLVLHSFHMVILLARQKISSYNFLLFLQVFLLFLSLLVGIYFYERSTISSYIYSLYVSFGTVLLISSASVYTILRQDKSMGYPPIFAMFKLGVTNQLGNLAHTLSNRFNYYMIGGGVLVGVYANSTSLVESIWIISGSAAPMILTHVANTVGKQNTAGITLYVAKICFLLSIGCVLILSLLPNALFVSLLGEEFSTTKTFMLYLSPGILAISFSTILSHYFSGNGEQKVQLFANVAGLCCTLVLSYGMITRYGLKGACITASIAYGVQAIILTLVFFKRENLNWKALWGLKNDTV